MALFKALDEFEYKSVGEAMQHLMLKPPSNDTGSCGICGSSHAFDDALSFPEVFLRSSSRRAESKDKGKTDGKDTGKAESNDKGKTDGEDTGKAESNDKGKTDGKDTGKADDGTDHDHGETDAGKSKTGTNSKARSESERGGRK